MLYGFKIKIFYMFCFSSKNKKYLIFFLLNFAWLNYNQVIAMLPVMDVNAISELSSQYSVMQEQVSKMSHLNDLTSSIDTKTKSLVDDAEGNYGFGDLYNTDKDLEAKQYSPDSWDDALHQLSGGNEDRYQQLVKEYAEDHETIDHNSYAKGSTDSDASVYDQQVNTNTAAAVNSSYAFDNINDELGTVHSLSEKIESADNTKAAIDLNSRLTAELAYIQLESLKMQSIQNEQVASNTSVQIHDETLESTYRALPDDDT